MIRGYGLRLRMMILFCAVVGSLLALSFAGFYFMFASVMHQQLDEKLRETAAPIIVDLIADPTEPDVDQLDIKGQYFEVVDESGHVAQKSKNLSAPLSMVLGDPGSNSVVFQTLQVSGFGEIRVGAVPYLAAGQRLRLLVGVSTHDVDAALETLRRSALILFPIGLLLTAAISGVYAARSLKPVAELTDHAAGMIERLSNVSAMKDTLPPLDVRDKDELQALAQTFNRLFECLDTVIGQLRQFVSDASHELRTPLSVLRGETELLLARPRSTAEYEGTLRIIDSELKKLSHIVEGLFTLSMADAGQLRIAAEPLYLEEVIEETCTLAAPMASSKRIRIERDLQRDVYCRGDAAFLRQLFLIFIDNAIKYSPPDTRLRVSMSVDAITTADVLIHFQDQGIGISNEHKPRIFDRFFRVSQTGSGDTQSGGLGLSIAQAIVQAHHGTIECESEPGVGTIFTVRLPIMT